MPIEIRELVIRAVVAAPAHALGTDNRLRERTAEEENDERRELIEECVRQVMRILQQKKAR